MGRQVDRHADSVDNLSKHELHGVPAAVSFVQLLEGDWLAAEWGVSIRHGPEGMVD